ncbi:hypothetical protein EHT25_22315 [Larkinella rosea]|uniref:Uncharacterized protein n=2 Tax=Larkinella rosea TaxID=2025312 RepID=A0A3P1BIV6_9BACT|nr:hypothetical protein EHT25_22315 [Larkinella rosea]
MSCVMVASSNQSILEKVVHAFGYRSTEDFLRIEIRNLLQQKIAYYQGRIDFYEQKYGMNFDEFRRRIVDKSDPVLSKFGMIEKEDDDNDWDDSIDFMLDYSNYLQQINP